MNRKGLRQAGFDFVDRTDCEYSTVGERTYAPPALPASSAVISIEPKTPKESKPNGAKLTKVVIVLNRNKFETLKKYARAKAVSTLCRTVKPNKRI